MTGTNATAVALGLTALLAANAAEPPRGVPEDGVYILHFDGQGTPVRLTDGSRAGLGRRLAAGVGTGTSLRSISNDNTWSVLQIKGVGPFPADALTGQTALVADGICLHLGLPEKPKPGEMANVWTNVENPDAARVLAARYKLEPQRRVHPGHRLEARWTPDKLVYAPGEPVTLRLDLRNAGTVPVRFQVGGQQRGPRDNQFRFLAYEGHGGGKAVPDTGDPLNFGGMATSKRLGPGDVFTTTVGLDKWFKFPGPGTYTVTGMIELPLRDPDAENHFGRTIWDDLPTADCLVRITRDEKPAGGK